LANSSEPPERKHWTTADSVKDDHRALADALGRLWVETAYSLWDVRDARTVVLTLIRKGCAQLADSLRRAGIVHDAIAHWIDGIKDDPLPDVRYALE
jgi:hypothetical protein